MLKYGTKRVQHHHMKSILVEAREAFTVSAENIIRDSFSKTHLSPLIYLNTIRNTQACVASIQTSSKGINHIAEETLENIKCLTTRTKNPMVILRAKGSTQKPPRNILLRAVAYDTVPKQTVLPLQNIF